MRKLFKSNFATICFYCPNFWADMSLKSVSLNFDKVYICKSTYISHRDLKNNFGCGIHVSDPECIYLFCFLQIANALYYNPSLALSILHQLGVATEIFNLWFQMIQQVKRSGARANFKRCFF